MKSIKFITSNQGKIKTINKSLESINANTVVEGINLDIIEPQADSVKEVSLIKAKKAFELLKEPFIVEGIEDEISVGCSIGVAHYPAEGKDGLELKQIADDRMYEDKKANGAGR